MKRSFATNLVPPIVYILVGIYTVITGGQTLPTLCCVLGGAVLAMGGLSMLRYLGRPAEENLASNDFMFGCVQVVAGLVLVVGREVIVTFIPFCLGFFITANGIRELQYAVDAWKLNVGRPLVVFLISLVNLAAGILFMVNPWFGVEVLMTALGIGLILSGAVDLVTTIIVLRGFRGLKLKVKEKEKEKE